MATLDNILTQLNFPLEVIDIIYKYDLSNDEKQLVPLEEMNNVFEKIQFIKMSKSVITQLNDISFEKRQSLYMYDSIMEDFVLMAKKNIIRNVAYKWLQDNLHLPINSRSYSVVLDDEFNYDWKIDEDEMINHFNYRELLKESMFWRNISNIYKK
jgi:hypothetical protein